MINTVRAHAFETIQHILNEGAYSNLKINELSKRLKKTGFDDFMTEVNKQSPSFSSKKECLPFVVADIYNKRRNENNKLKKLYLRD